MAAQTPITEAGYYQRAALSDITTYASRLRRSLEEVKRAADYALLRMAEGQMVDGAHGAGPLGHQAPFDIAGATFQLDAAFKAARVAGCSSDEIAAAYAAAVTAV